MLVEPVDKSCVTGVIFFNNVGYLNMCGHGAIGVVATLAHMGAIRPGVHKIETPVGVVTATLHGNGEVSIENVPSWRAEKNFSVYVPGIGPVVGDVAWGGNWFFLVEKDNLDISIGNIDELVDLCRRVKNSVNARAFPEVDHIELCGLPKLEGSNARNFVLCPGNAYDRSPCGTGTSAKLACLAADGKLAEGVPWIQESVIGSKFSGNYRWLDRAQGKIIPTITGRAFITAESTLLLDPSDPFCWGIRG